MVLNSGSGGAPSGQALHGPDHQRRLLRPQEASEAAEAEEGVQGHIQRGADAAPPRPQGPPRSRGTHGRGQGFKLTTSTAAAAATTTL